MRSQTQSLLVGIALTLVVHGALAIGYGVYYAGQDRSLGSYLGQTAPALGDGPLLCGERRCPQLAVGRQRRAPEPPPLADFEVLEAAVIPALGEVEPDPRRLPEIETYEQPEIVEEGVNLEKTPSKLEKIIKGEEAKPALRDPKSKSDLTKILDDDPDPRANPKDLSSKIGVKSGDVMGVGVEERLGHAYSAKVAREIQRAFRVPPFLDRASLKKLKVRVQVSRLSHDGSIEAYRLVAKSGDGAFDDAALAAIKQFVGREGGPRRLPVPEPDVLRFINAKGLTITLDGRLIR